MSHWDSRTGQNTDFIKDQSLGAGFKQAQAISNKVSLPRQRYWTDKPCGRPPRYSRDPGRPTTSAHRYDGPHSRAS